MELDLGEIRKNIDAIDDQLLELFKQRMGLTRKVAEYKAAHNMVVFQSEREKAIIASVRDRSPEELKSISVPSTVRHPVYIPSSAEK